MKEIINYVLRMTFVCVISAFILSWVYKETKQRIQQNEKRAIELAFKELLPDAIKFETAQRWVSGFNDENQLVGKIVSSEKRGYSSRIKIFVGLDIQKKITGIEIVAQNETPGLGDRIKSAKFLKQFVGKDKSQIPEVGRVKRLPATSKVHTITGATISSKAVIEAVREGVEKIEQESW